MEISKWVLGLPKTEEWSEPGSVDTLVLIMNSGDDGGQAMSSLCFKAQRGGNEEDLVVTFSLELVAAPDTSAATTVLWVSSPCRFSEVGLVGEMLVPLLVQLLEEIINRAQHKPMTGPLFKLGSEVSDTLLSYPSESILHFLDFTFTCRFLWVCLCDVPSGIGSRLFEKFTPALVSSPLRRELEGLLMSIGGDLELKFMRSLGYLYTKLLILKNLDAKKIDQKDLLAYSGSCASASHELLVLKGYAPLLAMNQEWTNESKQSPALHTTESVLRYTLAHQQLEAVVQFEYSFNTCEKYTKVDFKIDNIRIKVNQLRFDGSDVAFSEKHFPSRVSISLGPKPGSSYATAMSLGRSTQNQEKEVEAKKTVLWDFDKSKTPCVTTKIAASTRVKSWTVEQGAEGDTATFDMVLTDSSSGVELAAWRPSTKLPAELRNSLRRRAARSLSGSSCGLVFAGDEYGERVSWRLKKEVQGREMEWRIGCKVWLSYLPNELKTSYIDTRWVRWEEQFKFFF